MTKELEILQEWIGESSRIVFFGGAGVSTESGIPDFRSVDGLYQQKYDRPPEQIISHTCFCHEPEEFFRFYRDKMIWPDARPNAAHRKLAQLELAGKLRSVVTQNIDGLHQAAGSRRVWELHGSIHRNRCMDCGQSYTLERIMNSRGVPRCSCGGIIKPDVVLYEEALDSYTIEQAVSDIESADMLIVGGTSLVVYPAAGLIRYYRGNKLVLINKSETAYDANADLIIHDRIGKVLDQIEFG